jgi:ADP-ribose pyrophosphatase YjhB (NUDIX family)
MRKATVVLLENKRGEICLARKKQAIHSEEGEIAYSLGLYNGYGGKMEDYDETIEDTAKRELFDESGVKVEKANLEKRADITFTLVKEGVEEPFMNVIFYLAKVWEGEPRDGDEMGGPTFFRKEKMPYDEMMPADKVLFQKIFEGKIVSGSIVLRGKDKEPTYLFV